jgi:hypothetical protein
MAVPEDIIGIPPTHTVPLPIKVPSPLPLPQATAVPEPLKPKSIEWTINGGRLT